MAATAGSAGFGALAEPNKIGFGTQQKSPFGAFDKPASPAENSTMVKPLFGNKPSTPRTSEQTSNTEKVVDTLPTSADAKRASTAFDAIDSDEDGRLPTSMLEALVDEVGEGLHGDELDKQLLLLDPDSSGYIEKATFVDWYCKLGDDSDDDGSLDTEERKEREEEKANAIEAFTSISTSGIVGKDNFPKVIEALGSTYCEEEHRRTIRKISDNDGNISQESFVTWYLDWLFGDGDDSDYSDDEGEGDEVKDDAIGSTTGTSSSSGWGNIFAPKKDSWKCDVCMVSNSVDDNVCPACKTV